MNDISDILFLGAAMVIFSMLTINTARSYQFTSDTMVRSDIEYRAIAIAQSEIDEIRWAGENLVDPDDANYLFEDDPITRTVNYGEGNAYSQEVKITRTSTQIENSASRNRYKISIIVEIDALNPPISTELTYVKTFAK